MEGHAGQDLDVRPAEQAQPDDGVEGIELDLSGCERGQVPAGRRRWAADPTTAIERALALEDAADRADGWHERRAALDELTLDGAGAVLAEDALGKLRPDDQGECFDIGRRPSRVVGCRRAVGPVDRLERSIRDPSQRTLDGPPADAETGRDLPLGAPGANQLDDRPTTLLAFS